MGAIMKRVLFTSGLMFGLGAAASAQVLFDNGPLSTGATSSSGVAAPAGTTWSEVQNDAGNCLESNTTSGFSSYLGASPTQFRLADDFTVPAGETWNVTSVRVYGYRTGLTNPSFTAANLVIWNGRPGDAGSTIVFGDTTTNRLSTSAFTDMYRIFNSTCPAPGTAPGTTRPIWNADLTASVSLPAGTYWVDFQLASGTSVIFSPGVTLVGMRGRPGSNSRQYVGGTTNAWQDAIAAGNPGTAPDVPQEQAFVIMGTRGSTCRPDINGDGQVNVADFLAFLSLYSAGDARADFTGDGQVNVGDFLAFLSAFAAGC
jgi:hypothetical protein